MLRPFSLLLLCGILLLSYTMLSMKDDSIVIAAFGDSLFAGYGVAPQDAFPRQLESKLRSGGYKVKVINNGLSGETSTGGLARLDGVLAQKPDIILLEFGTNDMFQSFPVERTRSNMEQLISRIRQAHIKLLVAGQKAPLLVNGLEYGNDPQYAAAFNTLFCDLAKKYAAACYPFFLDGAYGHKELMQPDDIHPNAQGVKVIVDTITPAILSLLQKTIKPHAPECMWLYI